MSKIKKTNEEILAKLNITALNEMQIEVGEQIRNKSEVVLTSPTGTGKTLAFLLPLITQIDPEYRGVQLLIIVPTRELGIQIEKVARQMATGLKTNVVYGGRPISKDKIELKQPPSVLVGTPGRLAAHIRRETFDTDTIRYLVLDEFDKSLEIGFDDDMDEIMSELRYLDKKVLTSATSNINFPNFVGLESPYYIDFHDKGGAQLTIKSIISPDKDKLETLYKALCHFGNNTGIIFCNYKDSIERISNYLKEHDVNHGTFFGGMEQIDRERALIKFRNGTHRLLLATDLAARGIDVPELSYIIHYHLPHHKHEFVHRNGRTARMKNTGSAYVLHWSDEELPEFIVKPEAEIITEAPPLEANDWHTVFVSGGRKDKISKGDIVGLFIKQGKVENADLGVIELKNDCAFVGVHSTRIDTVIDRINNTKLKKKKVRIYEI